LCHGRFHGEKIIRPRTELWQVAEIYSTIHL
jgi:hypothetical protein